MSVVRAGSPTRGTGTETSCKHTRQTPWTARIPALALSLAAVAFEEEPSDASSAVKAASTSAPSSLSSGVSRPPMPSARDVSRAPRSVRRRGFSRRFASRKRDEIVFKSGLGDICYVCLSYFRETFATPSRSSKVPRRDGSDRLPKRATKVPYTCAVGTDKYNRSRTYFTPWRYRAPTPGSWDTRARRISVLFRVASRRRLCYPPRPRREAALRTSCLGTRRPPSRCLP